MVLFLKFLVALLLAFTPFSFAATEPWAFSILQGLLLFTGLLWICTQREFLYSSLTKPVLYILGVLIVISLVQGVFPRTLLDPVPFYPITLMRLYTLEHTSLFMTYLGVVLLVGQIFPSFSEVKQLLWMLVVVAVLVALCALVFPNGEYIAKLTGVTKYSGAIGPFVNRNHAGVFFAMNALLALGLWFTHQLQARRLLAQEQKKAFVLKQVCLAVVTFGLMVAAIFTRSRGAMLSLVVGLFGYAFLCVWCVPSQMRKRLKRFFYTFVLLIVSSGWIYTHVDDINEFAHRRTGVSAQTRKMMYQAAENILQKYPLWGIGIGSLPVVITAYTEWDVHQYIERLHNDWLEITLGIGYIGAALVLIGLGWFIGKALYRLKHLKTRKQFLFAGLLSALLAMCTGSLVDFHFFIPGCALVFFVVLGSLLAPTFHKHHVHAWRWSWSVRIVLFLILVSAVWVPMKKTLCWRQFFLGSGLKTEGKLIAYEQGLHYYPSPHYAVRLAKAYYKAALHEKNPIIKLFYLEQAHQTAQFYLEQYPKDKELSFLYVHASRRLR